VTFAFALLFFMAAMMFGQQIAASVVEEKQSRLVEIIATAIPLRALLLGKVVGNGVIALAQVVLFAGVGLLAVSFTEWSALLPVLSTAVVWFVVFFAVGFFALACLFAVAGALASRTEDLQSTTSPLTTALMLVYFASFALTGTALKIASFVPIVSVVAMPGRVIAGDAAWWEPVLALLLMAGFSALTIIVGEKIYRRSLMQTRGRVSWKQALRTPD
jgi:ABC-2 type transport system permease protein